MAKASYVQAKQADAMADMAARLEKIETLLELVLKPTPSGVKPEAVEPETPSTQTPDKKGK